MPGDEILIARTSTHNQGYIADALHGIWARAPYLHNGSVPTLRHLLAPDNKDSHRPSKFIRGAISYDEKNIGYVWDIKKVEEYRQRDSTVAVYDATLDGQSNKGHSWNLIIDNKVRKLNWSGKRNKEDLDNILEYLKTL